MVVANNSPQSQNISGNYGVPNKVKRRVDLSNPGGGTNPTSGSAVVANTPNGSAVSTPNLSLTPITSVNSAPTDAVATTYGRKDAKVEGLTPVTSTPSSAAPQLSQIMPQTTQTSQVANQPTLQDFINEAQKLGQAQVQGLIDPKFASNLSRQLYGQNVGMSGAGEAVVGGALNKELTPIMQQVGLQLGQDALNKLYQEREVAQQQEQQNIADQFALVESGQLTGEQAIQALQAKGINPENYMTPEQVMQVKENDQLNMLLEQIKDPAERALINDIAEFEYYMTNGRTYEDELAEIVRTKGDLKAWREKLPAIRQSISRLSQQIQNETAKGGGFFGFGGKDKNQIARWTTQLNALKEILADVEAGKNPVYDVNTTDIGG